MTTLCLSDLINLSFGNCEIRNIKFRVLQWCLQIITHQLDFGGLLVEFRGNDSSFIQNEIQGANEAVKKKIFMTVLDEHKGKFDVSKTYDAEATSDAAVKKKQVVVIENGTIVEKVRKRPRPTSPASMTSFGRLEGRIRNLQAQIDSLGYRVLPTDQVLIQELRESQDTKPVTDLLNTMKITKRMTGAEEEIDRIASLLEVVAREYDELKKILETIQQEFGQNINETLHQIKVVSGYINNIRPREAYYHTALSKRLLRKKDNSLTPKLKKIENEHVSDSDPQEWLEHKKSENLAGNELKAIEIEMKNEKLEESDIVISRLLDEKWNRKRHQPKEGEKNKSGTNDVNNDDEFFEVLEPVSENIPLHVKTLNKLLKQHEQLKLNWEFLTVQVNTLADFAEIILSELVRNTPNIEALKEKIREIHLSPSEYKKTKSLKRKVIDIHMEICYRIDNIEGTISKYAGKIQLQDDMQEENVKNLLERIGQLEIALDETMRSVSLLKLDDNKEKDEILEKLGQKTALIDESIVMMDVRTNSILKEIKSHEIILKVLQESIDKLKAVKLDRFEFDELLSDKASIMQLNSKVSVDQFTQVYRILTKSIEKSTEKISAQKLFWKKWIDFFEETLETKLGIEDFHELSKRLKNDIKKMVNVLITSAYGEYGLLARGGKTKFMKNLQCISCDRDVIMKMENDYPNLPILPKLAGSKVKTLNKELPEEEELSSDTVIEEKITAVKAKDEQAPVDVAIESVVEEVNNEELLIEDYILYEE